MKPQLPKLILTVSLATLAALMLALACTAQGTNPDPGRYGSQPPGGPIQTSPIDPVTGLPVQQLPPWKDPNWKDPDKVLADVFYDGLPLTEVARDLRKQFKDAFDVLIPNSWQNPYNPASTIDPGSFPVKMQLKNVTASEVFNAMNLVFEIENTPVRWELQMNGKRPMAVIRVLPALVPASQVGYVEPPKRMIYFVGDLVGDEKSGGMPIEKLLKTVEEIYQLSYGSSGGALRFHKEAQLLIVTGTVDQIEFVQQTLSALRQKSHLSEQSQTKAAKPKTKADEPKSP